LKRSGKGAVTLAVDAAAPGVQQRKHLNDLHGIIETAHIE
jgi:hypothetical protein